MGKIGVLVAEDEAHNYELLETFLGGLGFRVDRAEDGGEAIEMARSGYYALLILDVNIPVFDGQQVVRMIRSDPSTASIRIIALTADPASEDVMRHAGANAFMTKPVDLPALARTVIGLVPAPMPLIW